MVALYHRDVHGGPGQTIDLALYEGILRLLEFDPLQFQQLGTVHRRTGNRTTYVAPSCVYHTRDGKYVAMAASTESVWRRLCQAMAREDLLEDPRFQTNSARVQHAEQINAVVAEWVAHHSLEEVEVRFRAHGVAYAPVYDTEDLFRDPHVASRGILERIHDPELEEAVVCGVVPRFSRTPGRIRHLGPRLGQHNREVYGQLLGYSEERLRALEEAGVIQVPEGKGGGSMAVQAADQSVLISLRATVDWLRREGLLLETEVEVDPDLEITGVQETPGRQLPNPVP